MVFERTTDYMNVKKEKSSNSKWILIIVLFVFLSK